MHTPVTDEHWVAVELRRRGPALELALEEVKGRGFGEATIGEEGRSGEGGMTEEVKGMEVGGVKSVRE